MTLKFYYHPLASFCWKVLIALYEHGTPFKGEIVNLGDKKASAEFFDLWPMGKIPVLRDEAADRTVPETTIQIEYLERRHPGAQPLLPKDEDQRLDARLWDRFFDNYVQVPMQKIVADRMRPAGEHDPRGVADAVNTLNTAYDLLERRMADRTWVIGENFTMADCAASPALFYATIVSPPSDRHSHVVAYFERLTQRPSFKRVITEARPYFEFFPFKESIPKRFLRDA